MVAGKRAGMEASKSGNEMDDGQSTALKTQKKSKKSSARKRIKREPSSAENQSSEARQYFQDIPQDSGDGDAIAESPSPPETTPPIVHTDKDEQAAAPLQSTAGKKMGIPAWLASPTLIPAQLDDRDSGYSLKLKDPSLSLSKSMRRRCKKFGIRRLFPVQVAVLKAFLGGSVDAPSNTNSTFHTDPWEQQFLFAQSGRHPGDLCISAPTGSGKTLGYVIPIVEMLRFRTVPCLRALVIVPTRDLVRQVKDTFDHFVKKTDLRVVAISGGGSQQSAAKVDSFMTGSGGISRGTLQKERKFLVCSSQGEDQDEEDGVPGGGLTCCDILIATPGRLVEHLNSTPGLTLQHLRWLVIDEADRLLNQSFDDWLAITLSKTRSPPCATDATLLDSCVSFRDDPALRWTTTHASADTFCPVMRLSPEPFGPPTHLQKLLFSATLTRNPGKIAALQLIKPRYIAAAASGDGGSADVDERMQVEHGTTATAQRYILPDSLQQAYCVCDDPSEKPLYLLALLYRHQLRSTLCFTKSVESAERLTSILKAYVQRYPRHDGKSFSVAHYSSSLSPQARVATIQSFNRGEIDVLVCTDALSRGLDLQQAARDEETTTVGGAHAIINYDTAPYIKTYVHRVGRTARAGRKGFAYTILSANECRFWKEMMRKHGLYSRMLKITEHQWSTEVSAEEQAGDNVNVMAVNLEQMGDQYAQLLAELRVQWGKDVHNPYAISQ